MLAIQHILCPVDFSETSDRVLEYALALVEHLGSSITVMHAYQIPAAASPSGSCGPPRSRS